MKKFLLMLLPLAALVTGCRYDDSEVWEELNNHEQRILALEKAINTDLASVSGIVAELQNKVYVGSVTPTANGFTLNFTDGKSYTVTNGTNGETPNIGVKQDTDGNYYWTLNGEWLTDAAGNKIRTTGDQGEQGIAGITPQVKIQDNKWYVSVDNGKTWTEAGAATVVGDSLFKEVKLDAEGKNVIFTFQDGSTITIPVVPVVKKLQLLFDETQIASIMSGATATVDYEISGPEDETVEFDTFENNGYKVVVTPADATKGTIAVTAPDPAVKGKVLFILTGSKGSSFVKTVTINANPAVTPDKTEYNVDSKAGEVEITVAANIAYTSKIVATKGEDITWITKGSAENKFVVTENATLEDRSVNIVFSAEGVEDVTVKLTQACKDAIVVTAEEMSKEIEAAEGTFEVAIRTNVEVTATPDVEWITLDEGTKALADKKFSFKIAANTGVTRTGHIDFTAGELKQTVTVTQGSTYAFETVAQLNAKVTATSAELKGYLKNAVVSFVPQTGTAIITDGTGSVMYYKSNHGLKQGQTFTGEVTVTAVLYRSQYSEITAMDATFTGDGAVVDPEEVTLEQLTADYKKYQNAYVKVTNLEVTAVAGRNIFVKNGDKTYVVYANYTNKNRKYEVITAVGTVTRFIDNDTATDEIKVWKADDLTIVTPSTLPTIKINEEIPIVPADGSVNFAIDIEIDNYDSSWSCTCNYDGVVITSAFVSSGALFINVSANTGEARSGWVEIVLSKAGEDDIKVNVSISQAGATVSETKELSFSFTSNPGGWPTTSSALPQNYKYSLNGVDYKFSLKNIKQSSGYLMIYQVGTLGLPAISGYKLTKVVAYNSSGCSTAVKVGISSTESEANYVSGGEVLTFSTANSQYTYNLTGTSADKRYYIYVTNKNCQLVKLDLTYEKVE